MSCSIGDERVDSVAMVTESVSVQFQHPSLTESELQRSR